jgi:hypothetical protein
MMIAAFTVNIPMFALVGIIVSIVAFLFFTWLIGSPLELANVAISAGVSLVLGGVVGGVVLGVSAVASQNRANEQLREQQQKERAEFKEQARERMAEEQSQAAALKEKREAVWDEVIALIPEEWMPIRSILISDKLRNKAKIKMVSDQLVVSGGKCDLPKLSVNQQWHVVEKDFDCGRATECYGYKEQLSEAIAPCVDMNMTDPWTAYELENKREE